MRVMLKSKIHRAHVTEANIAYEGSITIDKNLMEEADILPYEQVHVLNMIDGARFTTYAIEGEAGKGVICLNGAAARLAVPGDLVIIITYTNVNEEDTLNYKPRVVHVDSKNVSVKVTGEAIFASRSMRVSINQIKEMKHKGEKITMLTAYDYCTARVVDEVGIPFILVGDSLGNVVLGYEIDHPCDNGSHDSPLQGSRSRQ